MPEVVEFAYYPDDTPLFEGEISVAPVTGETPPTTRVSIIGEPSLELEVISKIERPHRTVHTGYFLSNGDSRPRICNVDLELIEQPSMETVARTILAAGPEPSWGNKL